ncbi:Acyl-CoA carboxylase epsilon subunit [Thermomonospora echinospora]|uniref:Acyl-CoA carboxylase epsilon subunit n=1 Tax=Thermomonospora echinospora TaxID=1992 RepID=A0A1H5VF37_9ACTN|nr:acyl-CoA carboxylase epsilon subunit [Thermomonospora echinospora]SEF85391.1 Acyl-CoA carboxylase epsilon subunit [Thermomonospora echinospora]
MDEPVTEPLVVRVLRGSPSDEELAALLAVLAALPPARPAARPTARRAGWDRDRPRFRAAHSWRHDTSGSHSWRHGTAGSHSWRHGTSGSRS